jgi:hypothetical protein
MMDYKKMVTPAIVGVSSFAVGAVAGYFFQKYRDSAKFDTSIEDAAADITDLESQMVQLSFMFEERDRKYDSHLQQAMRVIDALKTEGKVFLNSQAVALKHDDAEATFAVDEEGEEWSPDDDHWDYDEEVEARTSEKPYIIHRDEFFAKEMGFGQSTLTYYKGDDILCDENYVPIYNPERVVGKLRFGHGSEDPHIVYVRNEEHMGEYEILLEYGNFSDDLLEQKVAKDLGTNDLKHSILKFRSEME